MKKLCLALLAIQVAPIFAKVEIPVVKDYSMAETVNWKGVANDQLPGSLLQSVEIDVPSKAYSKDLPNIYFQNDLVAVCLQDCSRPDQFGINQKEVDELDYREADERDTIEQANVYYWLNKYFSFVNERFKFSPKSFLKVMANEKTENDMRDNAFFHQKETSLNFTPASKNLKYLLKGKRINRTGFDPSVVAHETSHFFFEHLYRGYINYEIYGLNEGFADYITNIFLNNPKIGLVMLRGKAMRDSSSLLLDGRPKIYTPNLEQHQLGAIVATALWQTRQVVNDKEGFDRNVVGAVEDISTNLYSTVIDFKEALIRRLPLVAKGESLLNAISLLELFIPGESVKIQNLSFLKAITPKNTRLGIEMSASIPEEVAKKYKIPASSTEGVVILKAVQISPKVVAILVNRDKSSVSRPYWFVMDQSASNILAIYSLEGKLIQDAEELKPISSLLSSTVNFPKNLWGLGVKIENIKNFLDGEKNSLSENYKLKDLIVSEVKIKFNGQLISGHAHKISLKRRLKNYISGGFKINTLTIYTIPLYGKPKMNLPEFQGEKVVGYESLTEDIVTNKIMITDALISNPDFVP
ncbi:MAG: hypothetical protein AB7I27_02180 [Bacteriovoracaceae bacterium]